MDGRDGSGWPRTVSREENIDLPDKQESIGHQQGEL